MCTGVDVRTEKLPDLILVLRSNEWGHEEELRVYGLGFEEEGKCMNIFKFLFSFNRGVTCGVGFAVSGTKLFAVGGPSGRSNKNVQIWDLTGWRNRDEFLVERGQTQGDKTRSVVFEYGGRIYALAGMGPRENHNHNPTFERFDPNTPELGWKTLPDPPFLQEYSQMYSPLIKSHFVTDETLYVGLSDMRKVTWKYYAYLLRWDQWVTLDISDVKPIVKTFMNHFQLQDISPVDENMMAYECRRNMEVHARDLDSEEVEEHGSPSSTLSPLKDATIPDCYSDEDTASTTSDDRSLNSDDVDDYEKRPTLDLANVPDISSDPDHDFSGEGVLPRAYLPVDGFEDVRKENRKCYPNSQMVAHLSGNTYCLMYFYFPPGDEVIQKIKFFTFSALRQPEEKHSLKATVIGQSPCFKGEMIMNLLACCKLNPVANSSSDGA